MTIGQWAVAGFFLAAALAAAGAVAAGLRRPLAAGCAVLVLASGTLFAVDRLRPEHTTEPETALQSASVTLGSTTRTTVYFGQVGALVARLAGRVDFTVVGGVLANEPTSCVLTTIAEGVPTGRVLLFADGLSTGWIGMEDQPQDDPTRTGFVIHQQLIAPPTDTAVGQRWDTRTLLSVDGAVLSSSSAVRLELAGRDASGGRWLLGDRPPVRCGSTTR